MGGQRKFKSRSAASKKSAAALKKAGKGLFKVKTCSSALASITGKNKMNSCDAVKAVWAYIKKKGLNNGRNVKAVGGVFGGGSMFKLAGAIQKPLKRAR